MYICEEMQKLRDWLDQYSIPWEDNSDDVSGSFHHDIWICRTRFTVDDNLVSVINGAGTYGGYSWGDGATNRGLLEVMSSMIGPEPIGYLTADALIDLLKEKCHLEEIAKGVEQDIEITQLNS